MKLVPASCSTVNLSNSSAGFMRSPKRWMASWATGRLSMACIIVWVSARRVSPAGVGDELYLPIPRSLCWRPLFHQHLGGSLVGRRLPQTCPTHAHSEQHHHHHHRPRSSPPLHGPILLLRSRVNRG